MKIHKLFVEAVTLGIVMTAIVVKVCGAPVAENKTDQSAIGWNGWYNIQTFISAAKQHVKAQDLEFDGAVVETWVNPDGEEFMMISLSQGIDRDTWLIWLDRKAQIIRSQKTRLKA